MILIDSCKFYNALADLQRLQSLDKSQPYIIIKFYEYLHQIIYLMI